MHEADTLLGQPTRYGGGHDPGLLRPLQRAPARAALGIGSHLPFVGCDIWNAYEFSWLDARGKPQVAIVEFSIDAESPAIIESKSLKLYLNGFAQARPNGAELKALLQADLGAATGSVIGVTLIPPARFAAQHVEMLDGRNLDVQEITIEHYGPPHAEFLRSRADSDPVEETLRSDLFRSLCPVTGQPDWASVQIRYRGTPIDHAGLLRYLVSYREHSGFHEDCVERIFVDIQRQCAPLELHVYARFTRRGGIDINPWRSSVQPQPPGNPRSARQ